MAALETYFGSEYPYDKLDLLAVPDKSGAMENAGAITCNEGEILLDEKRAPVEQRYAFAAYIGHEIAHQWFGDLVTMPWWDDLWLNEAFATWMEPRLVAAVRPELHPEIRALESAHTAMAADSLVSARKVRQEIADDNDIESAFDAITYDKGGAVLSMFERWIGADAFRKGVRGYLGAHRFGTASATDLLAALSTAAGRDVAAPFRTFLDQPGLPFVDASLSCEGPPKLHLKQSRFLPVGSKGAGEPRTWQIPVCARYLDGKEIREACTLLDAATGELPLPAAACPAWVMPNADATGYYRWALAPADGKRLAKGMSALTERERMSFAVSLTANFSRGAAPVGDVLDALAPLAADPSYAVAGAPMGLLSAFGRWLEGDPLHARVETYGAALYAPVFRALGWQAKKGEPDRSNLRQNVLAFLLFTVRDPALRREAAARGRAYIGVDAARQARGAGPLRRLAGPRAHGAPDRGGGGGRRGLRRARGGARAGAGRDRAAAPAGVDRQRGGARSRRARPRPRARPARPRERGDPHPPGAGPAPRDARRGLGLLHPEPRQAPRPRPPRVRIEARVAGDELLRPGAPRRARAALRPARRRDRGRAPQPGRRPRRDEPLHRPPRGPGAGRAGVLRQSQTLRIPRIER